MYRLVYVSTAERLLSGAELLEILHKSRQNNAALGITGMLLYKGGNFMQLLEGDKARVLTLYETICRDRRHFDVTVMAQRETKTRLFPDWSMGYRDLSDPDVEALPGFAHFRHITLDKQTMGRDPDACLEVLRIFRDTR